MRHVLEHLDGFRDVLVNIYEHGLSGGGVLYIKIPCMDSVCAEKFGKYWQGFDAPRHRVDFTEEGVTQLLSDIGFKDIVCIREAVPSSYDDSQQFQKRGCRYKPTGIWQILRYIFIECKLLLNKKRADRLIVIACKPAKSTI